METSSDKIRAMVWAVLIHAGCFLSMFIGLWWTESARPINAAGEPVIQATLVDLGAMKIVPRSAPPKPKPTPSEIKPDEPKKNSSPPPKPVAEEEKPTPPVPKPASDTINQDEVRRLGMLAAEQEQREQEEKRKREQEVLEQEQSANKMENERVKQLADIRKLREAAEQKRKDEQAKLEALQAQREQQLQDRQNPAVQPPRAGTGGADTSLLGQYVAAIQADVTQNWLRPDYVEQIICTVKIVQIPGGEVISASAVSPCNADEATKRSVENAVLRANPLPYTGFEAVFHREINFNFCYPGTLCAQ